MFELSEEGRRIVEALVRGPVAWQSPAELASATGGDLEETIDLLAGLDAEGWLSPWDREPGIVVTLTAEGAARLRVRLVESGRGEIPRWAGLGDPAPPAPKAAGVFRDGLAARLELAVDPSLGPEELAIRAEEAAARSALAADLRAGAVVERLPGPTLLVGLGLTPWPGPGDGRKASCPACKSKPLGPSMYCLCCDRWGLDHRLRGEPSPRPRPPRAPQGDARRRDIEREARKEKRRKRRFGPSSTNPGINPRRRRASS